MSRRRVVVTGMGCVTASGLGVQELWRSARDGVSGVKPIVLPRHPRQRIKLAAHYPDFDAAQHISADRLRMIDRFTALALVAAKEAVGQAGLSGVPFGERSATIVGSGIGGATTIDDGSWIFYGGGSGRDDPMTVPKLMSSAAASQVSMEYGAKGPSFCVSSACSSSSQAVGLGVQLIRSGAIDSAIVGGSEAPLTAGGLRSWEGLRVLTPTACRPFSTSRDGMVLGEGAAVVVLEALDVAEARGATILAELAGYGTSSDAGDLLRSDPASAARAITLALADAEMDRSEIGYVNAHGTGTVLNDIAETEALTQVFGKDLKGIPVSSTKPIHGHTLGAAGAIELVVTVQALIEQTVPPTINWIGPDPRCDLDAVPERARAQPMTGALTNSFAFGGINACLVVKRFN